MIGITPRLTRPAPGIAALLLFILATSASAVIQHPSLERGFSADTAFQVGDIDHVNLFNGGLSITIPIGQSYPAGGSFSYQLTLVYSSKLWDWETICDPTIDPPSTRCQHQPKSGYDFNAGFGWTLSLGKLIPPDTLGRNDTPDWLYVGPDGSEHVFYDSVIDGGPTHGQFLYTRDNSFLRLRNLGTSLELHFPDGVIHTFDPIGNLLSMQDAFTNRVTVSRSANGLTWTLADAYRSHTIKFANFAMDGVSKPLVTEVNLAAFDGQTATYRLGYAPASVERPLPFSEASGGGQIPVIPPRATVQILTSVTFPDGSKYEMPRSRHNLSCPTTTGCIETGTIARLTLPTGGHLAWEYGPYAFPTGTEIAARPTGAGPNLVIAWLTSVPGVSRRMLQSPGGSTLGTWTYGRRWGRRGSSIGGFRDIEIIRTVTDAAGNKTEHYFVALQDADTQEVPDRRRLWIQGLPYTPFVSQGSGLRQGFLSREVFAGTGSDRKRQFYVRYEHDRQPFNQTQVWDITRRVAYETTRYLPGSTESEVRRTNYDCLGHYRQMDTFGNFGRGHRRIE
jgi:hypothetical protein